jgi:hypothetical protein
MPHKLKSYPQPAETFYFRIESDEGELILFDTGEIWYDCDDLSDEEVIDRALSYGYEDEELLDENGQPDIPFLRDHLRELEAEDLPIHASPYGRAMQWFEENTTKQERKELKIELIDGYAPGQDWSAVYVKNLASLVCLQAWLELKGIRVNFEEKKPATELSDKPKDDIKADD